MLYHMTVCNSHIILTPNPKFKIRKSKLTSLSDLYSKLNIISISTSRPTTYSTSYYLLTI